MSGKFIEKSLCGNPFGLIKFLFHLTTPDRIYVPTTCTSKELGYISDYCEEFYNRNINTEAVQMSEDLRKLNKVCFSFFRYDSVEHHFDGSYFKNDVGAHKLEICLMSGLNIKKDEDGVRDKYIKNCMNRKINPFYFIVPQMESSSGDVFKNNIIILKDPILELLISTPEERKRDSKYFYYLCQCLFKLYFKLYAIMNDMSEEDASNTKFLKNTMYIIFLASIRYARRALLYRGEIEGIVQSDEKELNHLDFMQLLAYIPATIQWNEKDLNHPDFMTLLTDVLAQDENDVVNYEYINDAIKELEFCLDRLSKDIELPPLAMTNIIMNLIDLEIVP